MSTETSSPTIALVAHDIHDQGGMERVFAELIRRLADDYKIVVVSATLDKSLRPLVDWRRVPTPTKPFPLKFFWFFAVGGLRVLRVRSDLVHVLGAIVPTRADLACIAFCHAAFARASTGLEPSGAPLLRRSNSSLSRWFALQAENWCYRPGRLRLFGAVSHGVARELRRHYPRIPIAMTPNGIDVDRYRPDDVTRRIVRKEEGIRDQDIVTLFVGGDWERKGLRYALTALALARQEGAPTVLWVVGPGDTYYFAAMARKADVSEFVRFFGPQAATERFFQAADVFLLPTQYETFSLVSYEAAATGLPIIATDVSGIDELLRDNVGGILVERDAEVIARALVALSKDEQLRSDLGASGQRRAHEYTCERAADAVRKIYEVLLRHQADL